MGDSGRVVNSLDFSPASLKSPWLLLLPVRTFFTMEGVDSEFANFTLPALKDFWMPVVIMCLAISNNSCSCYRMPQNAFLSLSLSLLSLSPPSLSLSLSLSLLSLSLLSLSLSLSLFFFYELAIFWSAKKRRNLTFFPPTLPSPFHGNFCNCNSIGICTVSQF